MLFLVKLFVLKFRLLIFCNIFFFSDLQSQDKTYWQQQVNYIITASLSDADHSLDGYVKMQYMNRSPDTLSFIWLHVYPNAFKNDKTAFTDQQLENGNTDFYFSNEKRRGYINRLQFSVDSMVATTEDHPQHQDIIKLMLPAPLLPGSTANIETPFHIKLPDNFSRGGHVANSYQITQWYPKPAVYDHKGWHPMPYLDQGEFYSEFGNYDVTISVPEKYVVAATGVEKNQSIDNGIKTLTFSQNNVHDFAWFADKDFEVLEDTLQLASKIIKVYAYHLPKSKERWGNSLRFIKQSVLSKSDWLGEYPYDVVKVVEKPGKNSGGMEYPTITLISTQQTDKDLDFLINHEVGHNWFYGILASNERQHPWMDEGMNSYYDAVYEKVFYESKSNEIVKRNFFTKRLPDDPEDLLLRTLIQERKDQPIETPSADFSLLNYSIVSYKKTAQWMVALQNEMGEKAFNALMHTYYDTWKFKHPYPEDFKNIAEKIHGKVPDAFALLSVKGHINPIFKKELKVLPFFSLKTTRHNYLFVAPALGFNMYDKIMLGGMVHNYTLPLPSLQYFAAPLYATGSKKIRGLARISYRLFPGNRDAKLEVGLAGATFTMNEFTDTTGVKNSLEFTRIVPSIKYTFATKNARSSVRAYIQLKSFFISERSFLFNLDTTTQQYSITYPLSKRSLQQLNFNISNSRKLYPWSANVQTESADGFVKANLTTNYYFNYVKGGGLHVRFFAGKFFYTNNNSSNNFNTFRYHYNMTGANGFEDYTYSNYFLERNAFEGVSSQQIMIRDGGFKVRTDLLSNKYGRSDDWLMAANFSSSIPKTIFPLPIKLFADIGTYAEAWDKDAPTGKFVYDGGLQISLLKNSINIYVPLVYSKAYRDYFKSFVPENKFRKNISFSIDIQNINLKTFFPQSPF